ncbi:MAG: hypothetical protein HC902_13725 [Calothrix sp. SM1_5_4]|nr:hypothetical protein [Calothrix sp. SM1_5_4]
MADKADKKAGKTSTQHELVACDLEFPRVQKEMAELEIAQLEQFEESVNKIQRMTWDQIYKTSSKRQKRGINWEPIEGQETASGRKIASIRISEKFRARVCRDGRFMRFISLHPDHDSAYAEWGGEEV